MCRNSSSSCSSKNVTPRTETHIIVSRKVGLVKIRDGKEPSFIGFGSVRVLSKMSVLVRFIRFRFGSIPISS